MSNETLGRIDELLRDVRGDVSIYSLITPVNSSEEKQRFLSGETSEPDFRYNVGLKNSEETKREFSELKALLEDVEAEESVQQMYQDSIREGKALMDIAENVGDPEVVRSSSREIYGEPSECAINWSDEILSQRPDRRSTENGSFKTEQMVDTAEKALEVLNLDWNVETREKSIFSVNAANQTVAVPENREFTTREMMRLTLHEIGAHAVRGANGYEQEYQVMGTGAGGYHQAEEGLALFLEEATNLSDPELKRKYAARVKSVESVINGESFSETYEMNRKYGFNENDAWKMTMRAHRGGGFIKDHVYAEGLRQVQAYVGDEVGDGLEEFDGMEGSLEDLLIGKVSVQQADALGSKMSAEYSPLDIIGEMGYITPDSVDASEHMDVDPRLDDWYSAAT